jgi:archaetidylinositol phosphate synthase
MSSASEETIVGAPSVIANAAPKQAEPKHAGNVIAGGSWTHLLARAAVRPLVGTWVTPNHLTTLRLAAGLMACAAFALGSRSGDIWGGVLWILSAFLDRADGELARIGGKTSAWGHKYDYICDNAVTALFFLSAGIGAHDGALGWLGLPLGALAGGSILASNIFSEALEKSDGSGRRAYAGAAGFDLDDLLYLCGPAAWLGWLAPILIGAAIVAPTMALITLWRLRRIQRRRAAV